MLKAFFTWSSHKYKYYVTSTELISPTSIIYLGKIQYMIKPVSLN